MDSNDDLEAAARRTLMREIDLRFRGAERQAWIDWLERVKPGEPPPPSPKARTPNHRHIRRPWSCRVPHRP